MQQFMADRIAGLLSEKLGTEVSIGSVNVGFFNRLIINDLKASDRNGVTMLKVGRVSASLNVWNILQGQITIPSAQLFSANATIYKENKDSVLNIQYVIDAFASKDTTKSNPLNLRINTLLVRHANVRYDVKDMPIKEGRFDANHLNLRNVGFNLSLKALTDDSLNVSLKRFSATENYSKFHVKELALKCEANKHHADIRDLKFSSVNTMFDLPSLSIDYNNDKGDKSFRFIGNTTLDGNICLSDFSCFVPVFKKLNMPYSLSADWNGGSDKIEVSSLKLFDENKLINLSLTAAAYNVLKDTRSVDCNIETLGVRNGALREVLAALNVDEHSVAPLLSVDAYNLRSELHYSSDVSSAVGLLTTNLGALSYEASFDKDKHLACSVETVGETGVALGTILSEEKLGNVVAKIDADVQFVDGQKIPDGNVDVDVPLIEYNGYAFNNIHVNLDGRGNNADARIKVDDENAVIDMNVLYDKSSARHNVDVDMDVKRLELHAMHLIDKYEHESVAFTADAKLSGTKLDDVNGELNINDIVLTVPDTTYNIKTIAVDLKQQNDGFTNATLKSDLMFAQVKGLVKLTSLADEVKSILASNLSNVVKSKAYDAKAKFDYDIFIRNSPVIHHFMPAELSINGPIHVLGSADGEQKILNLNVNAPNVEYDGFKYKNISVVCCNNASQLSVKASGLRHNDNSAIKFDVNAVANNNKIESDIKAKIKNLNDIDVALKSFVTFSDSLGKLKTCVGIENANLLINDTLWNVNPALVEIYEKDVACHNLKVYSGDKYLYVEGKASPDPTDSIVVTLNNMEIEYVLNIVDFTAVNFSGIATGKATVHNLLGKPDFNADLNVKDFCLEGELLGNAQIHGYWDEEVNGIGLNANIVNVYKCREGLKNSFTERIGVTKVKGFVSPADNDIYLKVDAQDTHANVLQGYLGIIFKDIDGYLRGTLEILGPLNKIDLAGDITGQMAMTLKATNVPYMIDGDTIHIRRGNIALDNVRILDRYNNYGILSGKVTHTNLRNFAYSFDADARSILVYDEKEFNVDKFCATVFASGSLHVDGSDGHPLNISGSLTSTKGSVFAYDNVSPDALANSSFIEFTNKSKDTKKEETLIYDKHEDETDADDLSQYIVKKEKKKSDYEGDIYMDFHMNLNQNCDVKLRMDRMDDAYITAVGNAVLQAKWHNKGAFQLFGTYNVERGSYRLYLHDLVYRDLSIQQGSTVVFNGNPFDAGIHLICNHEIHNVPLSDLTSTMASKQNNKVKVVCVLDISGTISSMDFVFDINLPNVSEEIQQLVKSMITSEEEMNTQVIYLLAVNRFYPNDFARANGEDRSGQAVNSFVSSTISGQINQMLSNIIGTNSNWNFGTGISTGEKGWQDMDVEGILSGRLFDDRLLINGNFGYRDNALTNTSTFVGDFELMWRLWQNGNTFLKAYNQTNDRYFTKGTLNTQGLGVSIQRDFCTLQELLGIKSRQAEEEKKEQDSKNKKDNQDAQTSNKEDEKL